ncbi:MAG: hypothetical protein WBK48_08080 [Dethiobacteria bacterium]|nr:hypothetical protein [Bacillota bacterium]HQD05405.1 hypothetical protein [Bacillota bacterium]
MARNPAAGTNFGAKTGPPLGNQPKNKKSMLHGMRRRIKSTEMAKEAAALLPHSEQVGIKHNLPGSTKTSSLSPIPSPVGQSKLTAIMAPHRIKH